MRTFLESRWRHGAVVWVGLFQFPWFTSYQTNVKTSTYGKKRAVDLPELTDNILVDLSVLHHNTHHLLQARQLGKGCVVGLSRMQ